MAQMQIDTGRISSICSTFKSSVSTIDLGSVDVAGAFEPFTSQGILTGYVSSLKEALSSISENCTNIAGILEGLAGTQETIDQTGTNAGETNFFNTGNRSSGGGGGGGGGYHSTGANNGNSTVELKSTDTTKSELSSLMSSELLEKLLSILTSSSTAITDEERASYLKELLKLKMQDSKELSDIIESMDPSELQAYLKKIYNGELAINDATVSITYDILEAIAKSNNSTIEEFIKVENMDTIRSKVEELSQEYITLFNSNDLRSELQNIYDGTNIDGKSEDFVKSVRTTLDLIAVNNDTTADALLMEDSNTATLKTEIGKISETLGQLRVMSTKSNSEFLQSISNIFKDTEVVATSA